MMYTLKLTMEGGAGEALFPVSPVQPLSKKETDSSSTLNASDLFALLEGGTSLPLAEDEGTRHPLAPSGGEDLMLGEDGGMSFLEEFTNLSDYLFAGAQTPVDLKPSNVVPLPTVTMPTVMEAESTVTIETVTSNRKRSAAIAALDQPTTSANTDHDDYVAKKPRRAATATSKAGKVEKKEERYRERRDKNNVASRRSREIRKQKFSAMERRAQELEVANGELEEKVEELERLTASMKAILVERLAKTV